MEQPCGDPRQEFREEIGIREGVVHMGQGADVYG